MRKKALLALMMAAILLLSGCALIKKDQAVDDATEIIRMGDQVITKKEVKALAESVLSSYSQNMQMYYGQGIDVTDPQYISMAQEEAISQYKNDLALTAKAKELGLDQLTDEELEAVKTSAQEELTYYQDYAKLLNQSALEGKSDEEVAQFVNELIEANGITLDSLTEAATKNAIDKKLKDYAVKDITVMDEET